MADDVEGGVVVDVAKLRGADGRVGRVPGSLGGVCELALTDVSFVIVQFKDLRFRLSRSLSGPWPLRKGCQRRKTTRFPPSRRDQSELTSGEQRQKLRLVELAADDSVLGHGRGVVVARCCCSPGVSMSSQTPQVGFQRGEQPDG